jgi:Zn-finger nucleic acid-binding protein
MRAWQSHNADVCAECGGVFLPSPLEGRVLESLSVADRIGITRLGNEATGQPEQAPEVLCPVCAEVMERYERKSVTASFAQPIVLDRCKAHGLWFDKEELAKLAYRLISERDREARIAARERREAAEVVGNDPIAAFFRWLNDER